MLNRMLGGFGRGELLAAMLALTLISASSAIAGKPEIDPSYADGKVYYMIGPHLITNPNPNLYAQSEELYLISYPIGSLPLPSGYEPQCNPCFHPGLPPPFVFHDHVLTGAPGLGKNGTAGNYKGPWKIIVMMYSDAALADPNFKPITSAADIDAAEQSGMFQPPVPGGPLELETGTVLICPFVAPDA